MGSEKKRFRFSIKLVLVLLTMGLLIYGGAILVGRVRIDNSIKSYHNQMAYQAAKVAEGYFTKNQMQEYSDLVMAYEYGNATEDDIKAVTESDSYNELSKELKKLRISMDANDIFIVALDIDVLNSYTEELAAEGKWKPIYYITDAYVNEDENYFFGDKGGIYVDYIQNVSESYKSGKRYDGYYISESKFGYNLTAFYPVVNDGKTIAFIGVEIPMRQLAEDKANFVKKISVATLAILIIGLLIGVFFSYISVIRPIELISSEINKFVKNNTEISDRLLEVKTKDEIQMLSENLYQMEVDVNKYMDNLKNVIAEKEKISAELDIATRIQEGMLPKIHPKYSNIKEVDLFASMTTAKEVGGDFYDFFFVDENHFALVMADVSGKGVPAALFMVIAKILIKNRALMGGSPAEILEFANERLCEGNDESLFVTVWLAIIDIRSGKGLAANAGHEHPALKRADGEWELIVYDHDLPIATLPGVKFSEHEFELRKGDKLFVYTDGVPDASIGVDDYYGTDRMINVLNANQNASSEELLYAVKRDVDEYVKDAPQFDDITMLALEYKG